MKGIIEELLEEMKQEDVIQEEMLRILLKEMIIKSTRLWKASHHVKSDDGDDIEFVRKFSKFVELHFREYHSVSEYAGLLNITPKALNKRIHKYGKTTPNEIIKNRIMLEAKRLLIYTDQSVKEIAYKLGYDDPAYFNRLFTRMSGVTPAEFKKGYFSTTGKNVQSR